MIMITLRRIVMIPVVVSIELLLLLTAPLSLAVAAVVSAGARSSLPLRSVLLVLVYAAVELRTLLRILRGPTDWDGFLRDVLATVYGALRRILDVRLVLADGSVTPEQVAATGNAQIVLARHCGPGDSLFVAWLLGVHYRLRPHIVLKSLLRWEPAVDLAGDHLPLCFLGHEGGNRERIGELAAGMGVGDALLLFPEGGNFSWPRWRRAARLLIEARTFGTARRVLRQTHTLPPHHGGAFAALSANPGADVILLAHTGFAVDGRDRPWWRLPMHRPFVARATLVPAAEVPRTEEHLAIWLDAAWSGIDAWVSATVDTADEAATATDTVGDPTADAVAGH